MKIVPKILTPILLVLGVVLIAFFTTQYFIIGEKVESIVDDCIRTTSNILEKQMTYFIESGEMEEFSKHLRHIIDDTIFNKSIEQLGFLNGGFKTSFSAGNGNKHIEVPGNIQKMLVADFQPILHVTKTHVELFSPVKITATCIDCHETMKKGALGAVIYEKFSLKMLIQMQRFNALYGVAAILIIFTLCSIAALIVFSGSGNLPGPFYYPYIISMFKMTGIFIKLGSTPSGLRYMLYGIIIFRHT